MINKYKMLFTKFIKYRNIINVINRKYSTEFNDVLTLRGSELFQDVFPDTSRSEISKLLKSESQCVYSGFDPTADSLHVGNLLVLINLLHWQQAGHKVVAVIGGATAQIGDPSGRTTDRPELLEQIAFNNAEKIKQNIETICNNFNEYYNKSHRKLIPFEIVNNLSWYKNLDLVRFIADFGRYFRIGTMLSRHSVQTRLTSEAGINFTEFSYQIFQAYDWLYLFKNYNCKFQVGGSDQMGNIVSGHYLISRVQDQQVYGLTLPLITSESGDKYGKSSGNAIWLDPNKTTAFDMYQFLVRSPDNIVEKLVKLLTVLNDDEIVQLVNEQKTNPVPWKIQKVLAEHLTRLVHGESGLNSALIATAALYNTDIDSLQKLSEMEIKNTFKESTFCEMPYVSNLSILQISLNAKCFNSINDAKRIINAGGFHINHRKIVDYEELFNENEHILSNGVSLLRVGKRNYYIVKWIY